MGNVDDVSVGKGCPGQRQFQQTRMEFFRSLGQLLCNDQQEEYFVGIEAARM